MAKNFPRAILDDLLTTRSSPLLFKNLTDDLTKIHKETKTSSIMTYEVRINNKVYTYDYTTGTLRMGNGVGPDVPRIPISIARKVLFDMPLVQTGKGFKMYGNLDDLAASNKQLLKNNGIESKIADDVVNRQVQQMKQSPAYTRTEKLARAADKRPPWIRKDQDAAMFKEINDVLSEPGDLVAKMKRQWLVYQKVPTKGLVNVFDNTILVEDLFKRANISANRSNLIRFLARNGIVAGLTTGAVLGLLAGTGQLSSSASKTDADPSGAAAAASNADGGATLTEAEAKERYNKMMEILLAGMALEQQKELNGCFLFNNLTGEYKRVGLLSCGNVDPEILKNAMSTCPTQNFTPGSTLTPCASDTFNPCLKTATSRSTDATVPFVPNVCNQYLYNGDRPANVPTGVTVTDACADQTTACSSFCKSDQFNLPDFMELVCVQVDLPTALVYMMNDLGYSAEQYLPPVPPSGRSSRMKWVIAGVVGLLLLAIAGAWYRRRKIALL